MYAEVAIDVPLNKCFTYKIPEPFAKELKPGMRVLVPFARKTLVGFCVSVFSEYFEEKVGFPEKDLKTISTFSDEIFFSNHDFEWLKFASDYYFTPLGMVLSQAVPSAFLNPDDFQNERERKAKTIPIERALLKDIEFTSEQKTIIADVIQNKDSFYPVLVQGVTGSGKTEVYIEIIKEILKSGKSVLYLVPEIGLTPQTLSRLSAHFPENLLVTHSGLTANQKLLQWQKAREDKPQIMVGTRSALFSFFPNLGGIILDEEHDMSYKQEDRFRYHARDLALLRAQIWNVPVVMGSATPSLEAYHLYKTKKLKRLVLPKRVVGDGLPKIQIIDFEKEREQSKTPLSLSQAILDGVTSSNHRGQQSLIFVGQRGQAQNAYCLACHTVQMCPNCDVGLKIHSRMTELKCHYCGYERRYQEECLSCGENEMVPLGSGTQKVEEELQISFPDLKIERVDRDVITSAKKLEDVFARFSRGDIDVLVGTQFLTKGHDFPGIGFVGVIGVDAHLGLPDFRAAERAYQTVVQVAGRSGRGLEKGQVAVQSFFPNHQSLVLAQEQSYESFAEAELQHRELLNYPPFFRLAQIRVLSSNESRLRNFIQRWQAEFLEPLSEEFLKQEIFLLGPSEMAIYKLRNKFRYQIVLKVPKLKKIQNVCQYLLDDFDKRDTKGIQALVDVDPLHLI